MAWCRTRHSNLCCVRGCLCPLSSVAQSLDFCRTTRPFRLWLPCARTRLAFIHSLSGARASDGSFLTRATASYPPSLARALAEIAAPFLDSGGSQHSVRAWTSLLPARACWSTPHGRVEDASAAQPQCFRPLNLTCSAGSGLHQRISSRLLSGSKEEPVCQSELQPFLDDLRGFLRVDSESTWNSLLSVLDGQPFRLNLWHCLSLLCSDPDSDYFHVLREGVPLGVGSVIRQCSVMHPPAPPDSVRLPLQHCESAWKSAIDHADVVDELLAAELEAGWICEIPGGDEELRRTYKTCTGVGKLGVVLAPGRAPRLVVDSSISGVSPNCSANPPLMDVRRSIPLSDSLEQLVALVSSSAHPHSAFRPWPAVLPTPRPPLPMSHIEFRCPRLQFLLGSCSRASAASSQAVGPSPSLRFDLRGRHPLSSQPHLRPSMGLSHCHPVAVPPGSRELAQVCLGSVCSVDWVADGL